MRPPESGPGPYSFERLASFSNLYDSAMKARKGKRFTDSVARFHHDLAGSLTKLRDELFAGTYEPGPYHVFEIYEPARRMISAAPYRDRVVHHALCSVIQPLFERSFLPDSFANQEGKGTHRAIDRCQEYARKYPYVLQGDIRKFFPSIDHEILRARLARKILDPRVRALASLILDHSNPQEPAEFYFPGDDLFTPFERRHGLPIGNLTSQFWANVYLDPFDHYLRDELAAAGYVRYVDDFLVFGSSKQELAGLMALAEAKLASLRLWLHPVKSRIYPVTEGIAFLGFRVFPGLRRLLPASVKRARRRLRKLTDEFAAGGVSMKKVRQRVEAWQAHARHGDTTGLRRKLLADAVFRANGQNSGSRRRVEQQSTEGAVRVPEQREPGESQQQPGLPPCSARRTGPRAELIGRAETGQMGWVHGPGPGAG